MKKLFAIAFTCVYLTLAVGVVQTTHYCMGRVNASSLFTFDASKCSCYLFASDGKVTCCNDEHQIFKIEDDHAASQPVVLVADFFQIGEVFQLEAKSNIDPKHLSFVEEASPPPNPVPLFTKHCSLVFYDDEMIA